jgi:hypothetical protein
LTLLLVDVLVSFMSAASTAAAPTSRPDPSQVRPAAGADAPSRAVRLLGLVRKLIDYGKELASTLQQRIPATNLHLITGRFGTVDIALILSLITRGLHRAAALEARLVARAVRRETPRSAAAGIPSDRQPRAAQPAAQQTNEADPRLAHMPTPNDIAAQVRRRPVGAVIADICRDLGITPSHPLWRELCEAINQNGGNVATLLKHTLRRIFAPPAPLDVAPPAHSAPWPPSAVAFGTGPP